MSGAELPLIFDIRRFALDDGPGIRTTVFFKGCPLACAWCHNPESMKSEAEIAFYPRLCIRCGDCFSACPAGAIMDDPVRIDRTQCSACGRCAETCPATALKMVGEHFPVDELVELLLRDRVFYETSGGGVTFSGGEPTLHMDYLGAVLKELKARDIHTAIQTCGMFAMTGFRTKALPYLDLVYYDLKLLDMREHARYTGKDNRLILENFTGLIGDEQCRVYPRMPLVPGITATAGNIRRLARLLKSLGCKECAVLPYNPAGLAKRTALGESIPPSVTPAMPSIEEENTWKRLLAAELA